jgi:hypothetical protein
MKQLLKLTAGLLLFISCGENETTARKAAPALTPLAKDTGAALQNGPNPYAPVDLSPMDVTYFPVDYPITKMTHPDAGPPLARVIYSRPHKQGRKIFGALLKYGEHWRLGANEATEIELFQDATIQGRKVAKGRYILYSIPQPDYWTIIFNSNVYSWGLKQNARQDKYRFDIPVAKAPTTIEFFTMVFQKGEPGAELLMAWDDAVARLTMTF